MAFSEVFNGATVRRLATVGVFERGAQYALDGHVELIEETPSRRAARVQGTMPYETVLTADGPPDWSCTCPFAEDGSFCKHCVAVALVGSADDDTDHVVGDDDVADHEFDSDVEATEAALIAASGPRAAEVLADLQTARRKESARREEEGDAVTKHIDSLPIERLRAIVREQAESDGRLRIRLLAGSDASDQEPLDITEWERRIELATESDDESEWVGWREASGWGDSVADLLDSLDDLADVGYAAEVIGLAEFAFDRIDMAIEYVDDSSSGILSGLSTHAADVHLRACEIGRPDPLDLAGRLVELELSAQLDGVQRSASTHADVLGTAGLREFKRLVHERTIVGGPNARAARSALEAVVEELGDVDELIALLKRDAHAGGHLRIVDALVGADRDDEAIDWGRDALELDRDDARREWSDHRALGELRDRVAGLLRERGDGTDALRMYSDEFQRQPSVRNYRTLIDQPEATGDEWYDAAVATTRIWTEQQRTNVTATDPADRPSGSILLRAIGLAVPVGEQLVELLMFGGRVDDAWEAAMEFGCSLRLRFTLAQACEANRPLDAIELYEPEVFRLMETKDPKVYESAVELIDRIRRCCDHLGDMSLSTTRSAGRERSSNHFATSRPCSTNAVGDRSGPAIEGETRSD